MVCGFTRQRCMAVVEPPKNNKYSTNQQKHQGGQTRSESHSNSGRETSHKKAGSSQVQELTDRLKASKISNDERNGDASHDDPYSPALFGTKKKTEDNMRGRSIRNESKKNADSSTRSNSKKSKLVSVPRRPTGPSPKKPWKTPTVNPHLNRTLLGTDKSRLSDTVKMYHGNVIIGSTNTGHGSLGSRAVDRNHGAGYNTQARSTGPRLQNTFDGDISALPKTVHLASLSYERAYKQDAQQHEFEALDVERSGWIRTEARTKNKLLDRAHSLRHAPATTADLTNGPAWPHTSLRKRPGRAKYFM